MYQQEKTPKNFKYNNKVKKNIKNIDNNTPSKMTKYPQKVIMKIYHQKHKNHK